MDPKVEDKKRKKIVRNAFDAVVSFVEDLYTVFGTSKSMVPLQYYRRIIQNVKAVNIEELEKVLAGFTVFFDAYEDAIIKGDIDSIPQAARITFGVTDKVYLEVGVFLRRKSVKEACIAHLRTISTILKPNKTKLKQLEEQEMSNSKEAKFLKGFLTKAQDKLADVDMSDPAASIVTVYQSGLFQDLMSGVQGKTEDGEELDPKKMMGAMQHLMGTMMEKAKEDM
jgi:hypothetical protein